MGKPRVGFEPTVPVAYPTSMTLARNSKTAIIPANEWPCL